MRHKSFYVLLGISILLVLMIRGCYNGEYVVNGKALDSIEVAWHISRIVFQIIAAGMFLMAAMLAMSIFSRDHADGSLVLFLSRSVFRWQYVFGRVIGTWILCLVFMFILHTTIFLTIWTKSGVIISGYLTASLISSMNLLFIIACVCLLSLFMPDFISAIFTLGVLFVGFVSDGGFQLVNSDMLKSMSPNVVNADPALWRILYPKVFMLQAYAGSFITKGEFNNMGPFHPVLNLFFFILLLMTLMLIRFNKKEV
jgi:ABC-type transport system involved in multi-copper enzyme maturation permease subunit